MTMLYFLVIIQICCSLQYVFSFKSNNVVNMQSKSIFSDKKHTETITPARYSGRNSIKYEYDNSLSPKVILDRYFPEVEYPINILGASKPFYVSSFSEDVNTNLKLVTLKPVNKIPNPHILNRDESIDASKYMPITTNKRTETNFSEVNDKFSTVHMNGLNIFVAGMSSPRFTLTDQAISQQLTTADSNKSSVKSGKMTLPELSSKKCYECDDLNDVDYAIDNYTDYDDVVEIFYRNEFYDINLGNESSEKESTLENSTNKTRSVPQKITLKNNEKSASNLNSQSSDTYPLKVCTPPAQNNQTKLNRVQKPPKRIGLVQVHKVKQRRFLKNMCKRPIKILQ